MLPVAIIGTGLALAYSTMRGPANVVQLKSSIDGRTYRVQNLPDKENACNMMPKRHSDSWT